MFYFLLIGIA